MTPATAADRITRWVCHRCGATVIRRELRDGEETPPGWAVVVIVDPPLADPHGFDRIVVCDGCKSALRNAWLNHRPETVA